jgi:hypothetical protein
MEVPANASEHGECKRKALRLYSMFLEVHA